MAKNIETGEVKYFLSHFDRDYYENTFYTNANVYGEKSTSYFESIVAADGIQAIYPNAKIIILLRNPVQRALSNYFYSKQNGLETRSLEEVFIEGKPAPPDPINISVSPYAYIERSHYLKYLEIYESRFKNVKVLLSEKILGNLNEIKTIYNWLGVNACFTPPTISSQNSSKRVIVPKNILIKLRGVFEQDVQILSIKLQEDLNKLWV